MSNNEWAQVQSQQGLSIRVRGKSELCISPDERYVQDAVMQKYRRNVDYEVVVEFTVEEGTTAVLIAMGARHNPSALDLEGYEHLPEYHRGMENPMIKYERGIVNICLGKSPRGVEVFNSSIISFRSIN